MNCSIIPEKNIMEFNFHINIKQITHGDNPLYTYDFNQNEIRVIKHSGNDEPGLVVVNRVLTKDEKRKLLLFLKTFPLKSLKNKYINKEVKGEVHTLLDIQIKNKHSKIKLYFIKQPDIHKLVQEMNRLIPYEHTLVLYD